MEWEIMMNDVPSFILVVWLINFKHYKGFEDLALDDIKIVYVMLALESLKIIVID